MSSAAFFALQPLTLALALGASGAPAPPSPLAPPPLVFAPALAQPETTPAAAVAQPLPEPSELLERRAMRAIERVRRPRSSEDRERAIEELIALGPETIPIVATEMERRNRRTWPTMVYVLGAIGDPRALPILEREIRLHSGPPYLEILYSMSLAGDEKALERALRSTHAATSFEGGVTIVDYIAGAAGSSAVPELIAQIPQRARDARGAALGALGTICDDAALDFLLGWSRQEDPSDRRYALMALARIGSPAAIPRLIEALEDPDSVVREAAVEGLGYLRAAEAVDELSAYLEPDANPIMRARATWSLGLIGNGEAAAELLGYLEEASEIERTLIVQALAESGHPSALPELSRKSRSENPAIAEVALFGLFNQQGAAANDALLAVCESSSLPLNGLRAGLELTLRKNPRATPCVMRRLRDEITRRGGLGPLAEELLAAIPMTSSESFAASLERLAEEVSAPAIEHRLRETSRSTRLVQAHGSEVDPWLEMIESGTPMEFELALRRLADLRDPRAHRALAGLFERMEFDRKHLVPRALGLLGSDAATPFLISLLTDEVFRVPSLERARDEAAIALARYARSEHAADALESAFLAEPGRSVVPLLALARVRGAESIERLVELKPLLLRRRGPEQVAAHERVNWAIRLLRSGHEISIDQIIDSVPLR